MIIGVEIDGAGGDSAAWRGSEVDPRAVLTGELAVRAVQRAEAAGVDFATFVDALEAPDDVPGQVSVRLDALGLAARVAPVTRRIGLLPTITVTHTEPFHVQASVATLDHISAGRGGWVADVSSSAEAAAVIGRREPAPAAETWREARYVVDVSRRLWDSWEDDAIIRDSLTGRYIDRDKLHYVDFESPTFAVKGPSIVPRPPQGHPVTAIRVSTPEALEAAADAELVLLPASDALPTQVRALRGEHRGAREAPRGAGGASGTGPRREAGATEGGAVAGLAGGRRSVALTAGDGGRSVTVSADAARRDEVAERGGKAQRGDAAARGDAAGRGSGGPVVLASVRVELHRDGVERVVRAIEGWIAAGVDGVHLRPGSLELDVPLIADELLPALRKRGLVGPPERAGSFRGRLGLRRMRNRYAGSPR
ncbi:LLM class flavin-dependent oxidoreductase [Kribbella sp. NPDC054772]